MNLQTLGWSTFESSEDIDVSTVARITAVHRSHLRAATDTKLKNLYLPGSLDQLPVVGDWVVTTPEFEDEQGEPAGLVKEVLPRSSILTRWTDRGEQSIAANVNTVFIVTSANREFKFNRLHRFLLLIRKGGAEPAIIISKTDLSDRSHELVSEVHSKLKVPVVGTSVLEGSGIKDVLERMPEGSTSVFVGSSGVGKSSLLNRILGQKVQVTKEIREDDHKGRHATTARQMFLIPAHGLVIDTPGVREVQVFGDEMDLFGVFPYIEALIQQCKFSDCQHETEPGCAVRDALTSGALDSNEWDSFLKLQREVEFVNRKRDKAEMANSKKRWKKISQLARDIKKTRGNQ